MNTNSDENGHPNVISYISNVLESPSSLPEPHGTNTTEYITESQAMHMMRKNPIAKSQQIDQKFNQLNGNLWNQYKSPRVAIILYSGHSQVCLDNVKIQHENNAPSQHQYPNPFPKTFKGVCYAPNGNQSVPNLNIECNGNTRHLHIPNFQRNFRSQDIAPNLDGLNSTSQSEVGFSRDFENEHSIKNGQNLVNISRCCAMHSHDCQKASSPLMPPAPNETGRKTSITSCHQSRQKDKIKAGLCSCNCPWLKFIVSVLCNFVLAAACYILYFLLFYGRNDIQLPANVTIPEHFHPNIESSICFATTNNFHFTKDHSFVLKLGNQRNITCIPELEYLQRLLPVMQIIRKYQIYINPQSIGFNKRVIDTAHAQITAKCPRKDCDGMKSLVLEDRRSCYHGEDCGNIVVRNTGIQIPEDGTYLIYFQISYIVKDSMAHNLTIDITKNSSKILVEEAFSSVTGYRGVNRMIITKLKTGDVLVPRISNSELFYNYGKVNYIGAIHLSDVDHH